MPSKAVASTMPRATTIGAQVSLAALFFVILGANLLPLVELSPHSSLPSALMSQLASLTGHRPTVSQAPVLRLETGSKYYKVMIEGMMSNFKKAVNKASEKSFTLSNLTSIEPISVVGQTPEQRVSIQELQIDGLHSPKVSQVYLNKQDMTLHVVFSYKTIKVSGRCNSNENQKLVLSSGSPKMLLEATNWNSSWSAGVMQMVGREHFDLNRVSTSHSQQRLQLNLKECPKALHDKLKAALVDRIKSSIEARLVEIMEDVIMHPDVQNDDFTAQTPTTQAPKVAQPKGRGKRASEMRAKGESSAKKSNKLAKSSRKENPFTEQSSIKKTVNRGSQKGRGVSSSRVPRQSAKQRVLKRTKRQTPCQQGEELDDYVDQLFRFGTRLIRAMEPVVLPNATIELPDYNLKIFLYEGKGTRAYKFRRAKKAWVFCSNETISLGVTVVVDELRVAYKYRVISGHRLLFDGDLEAKLSPRAQAQFSQAVQEEDSEEPVQQRVDRVRLFRLGVVHVVIRGLGNLTQSLSLMINSYLNDNQEELQPTFRMLEGDATKMINKMLASVNVPLLSVV